MLHAEKTLVVFQNPKVATFKYTHSSFFFIKMRLLSFYGLKQFLRA